MTNENAVKDGFKVHRNDLWDEPSLRTNQKLILACFIVRILTAQRSHTGRRTQEEATLDGGARNALVLAFKCHLGPKPPARRALNFRTQ